MPLKKVISDSLLSQNDLLWRLGITDTKSFNEYVSRDDGELLISASENIFADRLFRVRDEILQNENCRIVMVAGPSASGKTTFSHYLGSIFERAGISSHIVSMDNYFVNRSEQPRDEDGNVDYESPKNVNTELLNQHFDMLLRGKPVPKMNFDFVTGTRETLPEFYSIGKNDVLIIEGIHALNDTMSYAVPSENKYRIFICPQLDLPVTGTGNAVTGDDIRMLRRMIRDSRRRGNPPEATLDLWPGIARGEESHIFGYAQNADFFFNTVLPYEPSVLTQHILNALHEVSPLHGSYSEAVRLCRLFENFAPIDEKIIPYGSSILWEFIG